VVRVSEEGRWTQYLVIFCSSESLVKSHLESTFNFIYLFIYCGSNTQSSG